MNGLEGNLFLVKEHVGMFKAANNYDIYDPQSNSVIMECREPNLTAFTKLLRFTNYKHFTPFDFTLSAAGGDLLVQVKKGWTFLGATVDVLDSNGQLIGQLKRKLFSFKPKMNVFNQSGAQVGELTGSFLGWNFSFSLNGTELATVTKKWAGFGKELFTTADNYMLSIKESVEDKDPNRGLIFASVLCIDMLFKE
jgi:uncharacterized protein YxjI